MPLVEAEARWALVALPVLCFGFQGHIAAVPLLRDLQRAAARNEDAVGALLSEASSPAEAAVLLKLEADAQRRARCFGTTAGGRVGLCARLLCKRFGAAKDDAVDARFRARNDSVGSMLAAPLVAIAALPQRDGSAGRFDNLAVQTSARHIETGKRDASRVDPHSPRGERRRLLVGAPIAQDGGDETHVPLSALVVLDRNAVAAVRAFDGVVACGLAICAVIYNFTGLFGSLAFGMRTKSVRWGGGRGVRDAGRGREGDHRIAVRALTA